MTEEQALTTFYERLYLIRQTEMEVARIYPSDKIKSPIHLSIGQEFISVAVCEALRQTDLVAATYRGHAAYLAKGGDLKALIAELYGKADGCAKGRGGSMHLIESKAGLIGTSAVVGTGIPVATGYALAEKQKRLADDSSDNVVVCFLGDGATEEGAFYESLNFAGLKKLPIIFVVENNQLAIHEPIEKRWADASLLARCSGFGVELHDFNSTDVVTLHQQCQQVIDNVRAGKGPALIQTHCYRWFEHVGPNTDFDQGYREPELPENWKENDAIHQLACQIPDEQRQQIEQRIDTQIAEAFEFAEQSPFPDPTEVFDYVYK